jgi:hypothetical protein
MVKTLSLNLDKVVAALENRTIETPNSGAAAWRRKEYGVFLCPLVSDKIPVSRIKKDGKVRFEYIKQ